MPPRFWTSPYKNSLLTPAKREGWFSELPIARAPPSDYADAIVSLAPAAATESYFAAQGATAGTLVVVPWGAPGKYGGGAANKANVLQTGLAGRVTAFAADPFDQLLLVGGDAGQINVVAALEAESSTAAANSEPLATMRVPEGRAIDILSCHPLASSLLLATSGTSLAVFDASAAGGDGRPAYSFAMPSQAWSAAWSADGRCVSTGGKDGKLRLWDVRQGGPAVLSELRSSRRWRRTPVQPSRHVHLSHLSHPALFSTGVSRTRDREFSVVDLRMPGNTTLKTQRIDSGRGIVTPLLDPERGLVYLAGRGDQTLRWVEVPSSAGQNNPYNEGACALPFPIQGAALTPPTEWELMRAEIGRVAVMGQTGEIVPVKVEVPRRQYLDFHRELFPPVSVVPAQSAAEWRAAPVDDVPVLEKWQLDPNTPWPARRQAKVTSPPGKTEPAPAPPPPQSAVPVAGSPAAAKMAPPVPVVQPAPAPAPPAPTAASPTSMPAPASASGVGGTTARPAFGAAKKAEPTAAPAAASRTEAVPPVAQLSRMALNGDAQPRGSHGIPQLPQQGPTPHAAAASKREPQQQSLGATTAPGEPFNPQWSRKFLTGKTPLKPDYYDVHDLSTTMSAEVALLKASPEYFCYPLSGPGGRVAYHPLSRPGRLPVHPSCVAVGGSVVEFCVDPFNPRRVCVAGEDGAVRVFELPKVDEWKEGETRSDPATVLSDPKMDRISALLPHPAAQDLLLTVSDDRGSPAARLWDMSKGEKLLEVQLPQGGISSAAWSPSGARLAFATKKKEVQIMDPRDPDHTLVSGPSHDSIRPSRLAWASEEHLVSSGFNRSASRELILFRLSPSRDGSGPGKLEKLGATQLDVSVAPLFPFVDLDTRILLLHSRGDRSCLAYTVNLTPKDAYDAFDKLPSFEAGGLQSGWAYLPKARGDVRKVEIVKGLRLTPSTIEVVAFTVPRAKADFFQNDIFVPTRNVEKPSMTATEWINGENRPLELLDLRPEGMELLSNAPAPVKNVSTRSKIKQDGLTDSQREKQHLDSLFVSAKKDEDSEEDEAVQPVRAKHRIQQDDDDW